MGSPPGEGEAAGTPAPPPQPPRRPNQLLWPASPANSPPNWKTPPRRQGPPARASPKAPDPAPEAAAPGLCAQGPASRHLDGQRWDCRAGPQAGITGGGARGWGAGRSRRAPSGRGARWGGSSVRSSALAPAPRRAPSRLRPPVRRRGRRGSNFASARDLPAPGPAPPGARHPEAMDELARLLPPLLLLCAQQPRGTR